MLPLLLACALALPSAAHAADGPPAIAGYRGTARLADDPALRGNPFLQLSELAQTTAGPVELLTLGSGDTAAKPAIALLGAVSPELPCGAELSLRLAQRLADAAAAGGEGAALLERVTFYIIPYPSPDALRGFTAQPCWQSTSNSRPMDDDHDGLVDEDGYDDLDGDGVITSLRVSDPTGPYRLHPADSRVLIPAEASRNERGGYKLLGEGIDNDGDGRINEDPPGGVDFNRNFPFRYPYFAMGAGPSQVSEPETRAVADFLSAHPNIALVLCYSREDNLLHPWQPGGDSAPGPHQGSVMGEDAPYFAYASEQYRKLLPACGLGSDEPQIPRGEGAFSEWAYFHYGRFSLALQPWWPVAPTPPAPAEGQAAPEGQAPAAPVEDVGERGKAELRALAWLQAAGVDGFKDWTTIDHPDFPGQTVEVGGFKPYLLLNPPAAQLDVLAEQHYNFVVQLAGLLPRLAVTAVQVEQLGQGVRRVKLTVANLGYLPTMLAQGEATRSAYPLQYTLALPAGAGLVGGYPRGRLPRLAGNGGATELTWIVRGNGELQVHIAAPAEHPASVKLNLETGEWEAQP